MACVYTISSNVTVDGTVYREIDGDGMLVSADRLKAVSHKKDNHFLSVSAYQDGTFYDGLREAVAPRISFDADLPPDFVFDSGMNGTGVRCGKDPGAVEVYYKGSSNANWEVVTTSNYPSLFFMFRDSTGVYRNFFSRAGMEGMLVAINGGTYPVFSTAIKKNVYPYTYSSAVAGSPVVTFSVPVTVGSAVPLLAILGPGSVTIGAVQYEFPITGFVSSVNSTSVQVTLQLAAVTAALNGYSQWQLANTSPNLLVYW